MKTPLGYADFIADRVWNDIDGVLRGIYKEASEVLGQEFRYPETI